jgi:hypothetical protein
MITPIRFNGAAQRARHTERTGGLAAGPGLAQAARGPAGAPPSTLAPLQPVNSLATLVAIQSIEERKAARRRATRRGALILDGLDALKLAILEGRGGQGELTRIAHGIGSTREETGDSGLDMLVDAIELRAKVEMAKRGR